MEENVTCRWRVKQHWGDLAEGQGSAHMLARFSERYMDISKQIARVNRQKIFVDGREHMQGGSRIGGRFVCLYHGTNLQKEKGGFSFKYLT